MASKFRRVLGALVAVVLGVLAYQTFVEAQPTSSLSRFPRYTTANRPTCDTSRYGHPYFDLTLNEGFLCDGTTYQSVSGVSAAALAANNTWTGINIWNGTVSVGPAAGGVSLGVDSTYSALIAEGSTADTQEGSLEFREPAGRGAWEFSPDYDSALVVFFLQEIPADGSGGQVQQLVVTANILNGSDTLNIAHIALTNADHTGTSNIVNLLNFAAITGDANSNLNAINIGTLTGTTGAASEVEAAIKIGAGWDIDINAVTSLETGIGGTVLETLLPGVAGTGSAMFDFGTATAFATADGSDTYSGASVTLTIPNATGTSNTYNLINIAAVTGDANTNLNGINIGALTGTSGAASEVEIALQIGAGWDRGLNFLVTSNQLSFGSAVTTGDFNFIAVNPTVRFKQNDGTVFAALSGNISSAGTSTNGNYLNLGNGGTLTAMDGSDTQYGIRLQIVNANHTSTSNTLNLFETDAITGDANANLNALNIGALTGTTGAASEVETAILVGTGWDIDVNGTTSLELGATGTVQLTLNATAPAGFVQAATVAVVGASQTIAPAGSVVRVSAGAAADVTVITPASGVGYLVLLCSDANLTFTDGGDGGATNSLQLAGNFVCSEDDVLELVYVTPNDGNLQWVEVARAVN